MNKIIHCLTLSFIALITTGCASKMPDNVAIQSIQYKPSYERLTQSAGWNATGLGLAAASRHVPGTIPSGVGIGIMVAKFLTRENFQDVARKYNHLEVWMPSAEAQDEEGAKLIMSALIDAAIQKALAPDYHARIEEFEDQSTIGIISRFRHYRVDGPLCQNWSCIIWAPIPTATAHQWTGKMTKISEPKVPFFDGRYAYTGVQNISFAKITSEHTEEGLTGGHWRRFKGGLVQGFDYEAFLQRISANLPEWAYFYLAPRSKDNPVDGPALLVQGNKLPLNDINSR